MNVRLAYGVDGLDVEVPDDSVVVEPAELPGLADERAAIAAIARRRLPDLVEASGSTRPRVAIAFPDLTRPMPNLTVLPPLLAALEHQGLGPDEVTLLCATGTHRQATDDELATLVGPEVWGRWPIHDHDSTDAGDHAHVGDVDGAPVLLDRRWVDADLRIATGFVEPHFFAGFSGGPKGVCPGLAALVTVLEAHSPTRIASPRATWTVLDGNPVHDFVRAAERLCPAHLTIDVAINSARQVTAAFDDHREACAFVERTAVRRVPGRFGVVVSTNSGHPLDRNLYQAVKGMAAAERVVEPGGTVVMAAACVDGVPAEGDFGRLVAAATSPAELVDAAAPRGLDRWQAQVLGRVLGTARVQLHADGLTDDEVRAALLEPVADVSDAVASAVDCARAAGRPGQVCVLPQGPQTVATAIG